MRQTHTIPKPDTKLQHIFHLLDGCLEIGMEYLIQRTNASSAYDVARRIGAHHHAIGNKLHNPCNNSCPNKRAKFTPMPVHKNVTQQDLNHADQPIIEPMLEQ